MAVIRKYDWPPLAADPIFSFVRRSILMPLNDKELGTMEYDRRNRGMENRLSDLQMNAVERARAEVEMRRAMALAELIHSGWSRLTGKLRQVTRTRIPSPRTSTIGSGAVPTFTRDTS